MAKILENYNKKTLFCSRKTALRKREWCPQNISVFKAMTEINNAMKNVVVVAHSRIYYNFHIEQHKRRTVMMEENDFFYTQHRSWEAEYEHRLCGVSSMIELTQKLAEIDTLTYVNDQYKNKLHTLLDGKQIYFDFKDI